MNCLLLIILLNLIIFLKYIILGAIIHPNKPINITIKEGFIVHLNTTKEFGKIKRCLYQRGGEPEVEIKLNAKEPHKLDSGETILPYSKTKCGIRVDSVSYASTDSWTLKAENTIGDSVTEKISVTVISTLKNNFENIYKLETGKTNIKCSSSSGLIIPTYCKIYDDVNILSSGCDSYPIVVRNKTSFKCNTLRWEKFVQSKETILIEPTVKKINGLNGSLIETDEYIILTCQFSKNIYNCKAELPDQKSGFFINDGLMNGRFSTLDTNTAKGKCVLEIKKPLKHEEIGIWTISTVKPSGCFFYVGEEKSKLIQNEIKNIKPIKTMEIVKSRLTETFNLECRAPFPIDLCYLVDPKNKIHYADNSDFDETKTLGFCDFKMNLIPGEYICGLSGKDSYPDEIKYKYKITITNDSGEATTSLIKTNIDESIELLCRIPFDTIARCAFIDPKRNIYHVSNFIKSKEKSRVSYFGDGIEQGHCGIKVDNIKYDDLGNWTCHIKSSGNKYSSFDIKVELIYHISEAAIGLGTGLGVILIIVIITAVYYYRKKTTSSEETQNEDSIEEPIHMRRLGSYDSGSSFTSKES